MVQKERGEREGGRDRGGGERERERGRERGREGERERERERERENSLKLTYNIYTIQVRMFYAFTSNVPMHSIYTYTIVNPEAKVCNIASQTCVCLSVSDPFSV